MCCCYWHVVLGSTSVRCKRFFLLHMISHLFLIRPVPCEAVKQGLVVLSICKRFLFMYLLGA